VLLITCNLTPWIQEPGQWESRHVRNGARRPECNAVIYHYVVSLGSEVYLGGKESDVHEGIISKRKFSN
jgi:hypothetical protein